MNEKQEECPLCGEVKRWLYDAQICAACGHGDRHRNVLHIADLKGAIKACRRDGNGSQTLWMPLEYAEQLVETHDTMLAALQQVEREMQAGFGSSFGETREQVRRAIKLTEQVRQAMATTGEREPA